ncbi:MAG: regulatory protein GemA [Candidatus Sedimenticola sp. 6PFRAG7]
MSRGKLIQLVHIGASKLFKDEDDRRGWQEQRTGHRSCSDMSDADLENLVAELRRKGALDGNKAPRRAGRVPFNRSPYMDKIEAQLASMGLSWQYAESIAWRITGGKGEKPNSQPGVKRLEWVRNAEHLRAIIAALDVEQEKRGNLHRIDEQLKALGRDRTYLDTLIPEHMHDKWQRNRALLRHLVIRLDDECIAKEEMK